MSKHINVNPDHYKVAGRERQGDAVIQNLQRQQFAQQQAQTERWQATHSGPPWEATAADASEAEGQGRAKAEGRRRADRELRAKQTQRRLKAPKARKLKGLKARRRSVAAGNAPAAAGRSSKKRSPAKRRRTSRPASQHKPRR